MVKHTIYYSDENKNCCMWRPSVKLFYNDNSIVEYDKESNLTSAMVGSRTDLTKVILYKKCKQISDYAFEKSKITTLNIPDSITSIRTGICNSCTSLTAVTIGSGITSIETKDFQDCTNLSKVILKTPQRINRIGMSCFYNTNLDTFNSKNKGELYYSKNFNNINQSTFGKTKFSKVIIEDGITSVGYGAFQDCKNLEIVKLPNTLKQINNYGFLNASKLSCVIYNGVEYNSKSQLISALTENNVTLETNIFGGTALTD